MADVNDDVKPAEEEIKEDQGKAEDESLVVVDDEADLKEDDDASAAKAAYAEAQRQGSIRAIMASAWVVDLERQQEGYTAGRWTTICSMCTGSALILFFSVAYLLIFCAIQIDDFDEQVGFGDTVLNALINSGDSLQNVQGNEVTLASLVTFGTFFLWSFIYVFDVWNWSNAGPIQGFLEKIVIGSGVVLLFVTSLLSTNAFPVLPFMTFWVFVLSFLAVTKTYVFPTVQKLFYLKALVSTLFLTSLFVFVFFAVSVFGYSQYYGANVQIFYFDLLECPPGILNGSEVEFSVLANNQSLADEFLAEPGEFPDCDEAFLVWAAPGLYAAVGFLLSGVMFFLYRAEKKRIESKQAVGIEPLAQVFFATMLLSMLGLWVSASIASATAAVGDAILSISFMTLILMMATAVAVFGMKYLDSQIKKTAIGSKAYEFFGSDWGKGLLVVTATPIIILFLMVDYIKQKVRTKTYLGKKIEDEAEKKMRFTKSVSNALTGASKWEWGSVITISLVWGMIFFTLNVGVSRMTIVFLSFLRESMEDLSLGAATGVLAGVGLFLFLLPPVPGVPVYVTSGVILPTIGEREGTLDLFGAIVYGTFVGVCLKMAALVMQQKIIGEGCGSKSVSVRAAVGINSVELRAMKKVLATGNFSFKKVAILCGGPDWPTSVLTGIMKLNVFKMMLGTTPIVFLIAPCVVSGAMLVKASEEPDNDFFTSINTVALFLTVVIQAGAMLAAAQVLATAAVKYKDQLENEPLDQEVLALEEKTKAKKLNYKAVTAWVNLGTFWKITHLVNLTLMIISCYAFQLFGSSLFITFDITDSIEEVLDNNPLLIVTEEGWIAVGLFGVATLYYFIFKSVHQRKTATPEQCELAGVEMEDKKDDGLEGVKNPLSI